MVTTHGSMTSMNTTIPTNGLHVIHPNLKNWPIDCIAANLIKENLATAETAVDLREACNRLEKLPSTEIVDPRGVLLEHRLSPSPNLEMFAIYEPKEFEDDYYEYILKHDETLLGKTSFSVQLNRRKLFDQVFAADGSESILSDSHAVFLSFLHIFRGGHLYLSDIIQHMLPKMTIAVTRPKNLESYQRVEDCYEKMEVVLVYLKSDDVSTFAREMIQDYVVAHGMEEVEIHHISLPLRSVLVPLVCRTLCQGEQF